MSTKARIERLEAQAAKKDAEVDIAAILIDGRRRCALGLPHPTRDPNDRIDESTPLGRQLAAALRRVGAYHH